MPKVRIYGTAKEGKRENWKTGYHVVRRDKKGHFIATRKWSQKQPIKKIDFRKDGKLIEAPTGKELQKKVAEESRKWHWLNKGVKSPPKKQTQLSAREESNLELGITEIEEREEEKQE